MSYLTTTAPAPPAPPAPPTLTQRASLTTVAYGLEYGAKIAVGLVLTPFLVSRLGQALYGVYEILVRLTSYLTPISGRPAEALRLVVASRQKSTDALSQQRAVGGALMVWLLFLPLAVAGGAVLTWLAPGLVGVPPTQAGIVRLACGLLVAAVLLGGPLATPESVLYGMNLGYKRMELQASLSLVGGALSAGAAYAGLGLAGVAGAQLLLAALTGTAYWLIARVHVRWLGIARPGAVDIRACVAVSGWLSVGDLVAKLLLASDLVIIGALLSPTVVTTYVLTGYAARTLITVYSAAITAAMPGLGSLIGRKQFVWAGLVRREMLLLTWLLAAAVGTTILLWNRAFLQLWVGSGQWSGWLVNLLLVVIAVQSLFIRADSYVIDAALQPRSRVRIGAAAAILTLGGMIVLTPRFGLPGLCLTVLAGRTLQTIGYPRVVVRCLGDVAVNAGGTGLLRPLLVISGLFAAATLAGRSLIVSGWLPWIGGVALTFLLASGIGYGVGLVRDDRHLLRARFLAITGRRA
jgi:O-antigen/teichoic acid export membrane protein